ncbi:MAG: hypothetical protein A3F70_04205 [Acidobacteria bacterium RIFCSPLOWO2_12_FULL_67_14]|nr:MAG: hypothetical protein A3H29_08625 [Acidobacteria bacterium RIFCSPLOWO2_02_FULL_67_21]OFW35102.1 MAG: hypothetical protein A3F70_04205 [Acidobacteria bacterium RIFCSPLOWO2_12_FULL_67_14]
MIKTLQAHGFIDREPGKARSITLRARERSCRTWSSVRAHRMSAASRNFAGILGMDEFSDIWIDQCQAARDIRERP